MKRKPQKLMQSYRIAIHISNATTFHSCYYWLCKQA